MGHMVSVSPAVRIYHCVASGVSILLPFPQRTLLFPLLFYFMWIQIRLFNTDPDPYHFKEIMYPKKYFLYILT
jgi:hypothetical protein